MTLPRSLVNVMIDNIESLRNVGLKRDSVMYGSLPVIETTFDLMTSGPFEVTETDGNLIGSGTAFSPILSKAAENPRTKNLYRSIGLVMTHDYFILIGESPGPHYKRYNKMNRDNTVFWDPRPTDLPYDNVQSYFTESDIPAIVEKCALAADAGRKPLLLIDIRRDKTGDPNEWERLVQQDNDLICKLVNSLSNDVTVCAKMRPAYGDFEMPELKRGVRMLPLPYLKHTTSEFNMFVPSVELSNGTERVDWTYEQLENMGNEVFVLKSTVGALYNRFLCDEHLCLGVINRAEVMADGTSALWSISNADNNIADVNKFLLTGKNFMMSFPYAKIGNNVVERPSRNRRYVDHAITAYDEVMMPTDVYVLPLYAIPDNAHISQHDFRNCVVTDDRSMLTFSQPKGVVSTQIVKLASFMLKDVFSEAGLNWTTIDKEIRSESIRDLAKKTKNFDVQERTDGTFTVNGRVVTVSGHMLYIMIGSILGLPYGIKKYVNEIEYNILYHGQSYERKVGGRVWHGLLSHYLALSCVSRIIDTYMRMDVSERRQLDVVLSYVRTKLLELGAKYEVYLHVDESDVI